MTAPENPGIPAFGGIRRYLAILLLGCLPGACNSPYTITLNERVLYTPNPQLRGELVSDPNLQGCLNQIMMNSETAEPESITLLACPDAGITSIQGIEKLSNLEQLELSDNRISDLGPLANLRNLRLVSMANNDIRSISPLMPLPTLRFVSLQGNENIPCRQLDNLEEKLGNTLTRPLFCNN
ncbi:MAG: hypothetical protein WD601_12020 [Pseudohongiellaceae bacterium]